MSRKKYVLTNRTNLKKFKGTQAHLDNSSTYMLHWRAGVQGNTKGIPNTVTQLFVTFQFIVTLPEGNNELK